MNTSNYGAADAISMILAGDKLRAALLPLVKFVTRRTS